MPSSIHEVAKLANVSVPTVSNVINKRRQRYSDATRERVIAAVHELGYQPNRSARLLRGVATHTVGVLCHGLSGYSGLNVADMIACLDKTLRDREYRTLMGFWWDNSEHLRQHLQDMVAHRVEAVVISTPLNDPARIDIVRDTLPDHLPVLIVDDEPWGPCDSLRIDRRGAMRELAEHLVALGHRHVAFACGGMTYAAEKIAGINDALRDAGASLDTQHTFSGADGLEYASSLAPKIMALAPKPTAVVCSNDYIAIGMMRGLRELGLRVPQDVSVTGYDGIWVSQIAEVPLTTMRQPRERMGIRAAEMILERIAHRDREPKREWFKPELVVRESTGHVKE